MSRYDNERDLESEGIPAVEDDPTEDEGLIPPRNHPQAVEDWGTTAAEEREGESFRLRMWREVDEDARPPEEPLPELVADGEPDEPTYDDADDLAGTLSDSDAVAAEEQAMHLEEP